MATIVYVTYTNPISRGPAIRTSVTVQQFLEKTINGWPGDVTAVEISVGDESALPLLRQITLVVYPRLRSFSFSVVFDLRERMDVHMELWKAIRSILLSLSPNANLHSFSVNGGFSSALLNGTLAQPPTFEALRKLLLNLDFCFMNLVDSSDVLGILLRPMSPAHSFTEPERKRIESLFSALVDRDMLLFTPTLTSSRDSSTEYLSHPHPHLPSAERLM